MISDVIDDAIQNLEKYLDRFPEVYQDSKDKIEKLIDHMREVLHELDKPPR